MNAGDEPFIEEKYDQILDELKFYAECNGEENSDAFTDVDSGYNTARSSALPPEQSHNRPRKTTSIERSSKFDVKLRKLKILQKLDQKNEKYVSLQNVAWNLLDFVTPKVDPDHKYPRHHCMFQILNEQIHIHRSYQTNTGYVEGISPMLINIANILIETHRNLILLNDFADSQGRIVQKPAFVTCWLEVYHEVVEKYRNQIDYLKISCQNPVEAIQRVQPFCSVVNFLASIITPVKAAHNWKFENVELAWSLLFAAISDESRLSSECVEVALKFQKYAFSLFVDAFDMLYYLGEIPTGLKSDFVLYKDPERPESFSAHSVPTFTALWSKDLIKTVHRGAILRRRLGSFFNTYSESFTEIFYSYLPDCNQRLLPQHVFCRVLSTTAIEFTEKLSQELFKNVLESGLIQLWCDMKNIVIGPAATFFATCAFNLEKSTSPIKAFAMALNVSEVSNTGKWRRNVVQGHYGTGEIKCEVPSILSHLMPESLIITLNSILDSWLVLFRMHFILVAVLDDRTLFKTSNSLRRQFRFFISKLYGVLTIIRHDFYNRIDYIFISSNEQIETVKSYYEAEIVLRKAEKSLIQLIDKKDMFTRNLWNVIYTFSDLIDDVRLKSLSNDVDLSILRDWRRKLLVCYESIRGLGETVSPDNIFFSLYKQMQYR